MNTTELKAQGTNELLERVMGCAAGDGIAMVVIVRDDAGYLHLLANTDDHLEVAFLINDSFELLPP